MCLDTLLWLDLRAHLSFLNQSYIGELALACVSNTLSMVDHRSLDSLLDFSLWYTLVRVVLVLLLSIGLLP